MEKEAKIDKNSYIERGHRERKRQLKIDIERFRKKREKMKRERQKRQK